MSAAEKSKEANSAGEAIQKALDDLTLVSADCNAEALAVLPELSKALKLARGIRQMRALLTNDVMAVFMDLQNTKLGFLTDKKAKGEKYPVEVVREVLIEATFHGFSPVNNEFNIIADGLYGTLNGYERKVRTFNKLTNLDLRPGVPVNAKDGNGALVPYKATWLLDGKKMSYACIVTYNEKGEVISDERIPVRVNSGMGADGIVGKATRKFLKRIYTMLSGHTVPDGDGDGVIETTGVSVPDKKSAADAMEEMKAEHAKRAKAGEKAADPKGEAPPADPAADSSGNPEPGANG